MLPDYYKILEIRNDASDMEIKQAYRRKVKETHPDLVKTGKAFDDFVLINEAYEILIHHNTRDIYKEDFKTNHDPMIYEAYYHWISVARDRALKHSKMPFNDFTRTEFYMGTRTTPYILNLMSLLMGVGILLSGILILFLLSENKVLAVIVFLSSLPTGIFLLVQSSSGMKALKKYH